MKDKYILTSTILSIFCFILIILLVISVEVINDLTMTSNGYKSDRNICRQELDSIKQDYERMSEEK